MPLTYYIDGYNVIHFCPALRPLADANFESARDALIERVARFCSASGDSAKIVFDGRGRQADPHLPFRAGPGLEVVYSPAHQSADALIERTAYHAPNRRDLVVVTGDRGIRGLCRGMGTLVMEPNHFLSTIDERLNRERDDLQRTHERHTGISIEERLDEASQSRIQALKKRLKK
ncbi:MAG: NYN domain-containing protein [Candidatus Hydrogenedentes bacterium]|nr:NYN domain-containing protein [Candidatus Hydrogenedentota bacterium]